MNENINKCCLLLITFSVCLYTMFYVLVINTGTEYPRIGWNSKSSSLSFVFDSACNCHRKLLTKSSSSSSLIKDEVFDVPSQCGDFASSRGPGQKVISFSLYGKRKRRYLEDLKINIKDVKAFYPGYIIRLYMDGNFSDAKEVGNLCELSCANDHLDICPVHRLRLPSGRPMNATFGMNWRFAPMIDPLVVEWHSRDLDSRIDEREAEAVKDWLSNSNATFHTMLDHPYHTVPVMGGLFGMRKRPEFQGKLFKAFSKMCDNSTFASPKGTDQVMLERFLWATLRTDLVTHGSYNCHLFGKDHVRPFPTRRKEKDVYRNYVGSDGHDYDVTLSKFGPCPEKCRPKEHPDWLLC